MNIQFGLMPKEQLMRNIMLTKENIDSERAHGIALIVLLALLAMAAIRIYYLQKDIIRLYSVTQALDNENAVQGDAIHRIIKRVNGQ